MGRDLYRPRTMDFLYGVIRKAMNLVVFDFTLVDLSFVGLEVIFILKPEGTRLPIPSVSVIVISIVRPEFAADPGA